ncbi:MAG: class I tRNA ligase family protein, partial [Candidatus Marsarchaeota archaeon]|nr:class I tRNA ligase family protein [Candidatus Marsarchaeota archaeon]
PVDVQGTYTEDAGTYLGLKVPQDANRRVIDDLKSSGSLVHRGDVTHSYPHCWRCDTKLIFIATDQWFVNIQRVKKKLIRENGKVNWHPADAAKWQEAVLQSSPDWAISRQRYWGTPMPIWRCQSCKEIKVIGSISELRENATNITYVDSLTDIHRPHIDNVVLRCGKCNSEMHRIADVLDVWFDSGIAYRASLTEEQFRLLFPMDFILEAIEQLRGWFSYQLKTSVIVHGKRPFKNVVMHGMMLGSDGREMHKKIGNYVPLHEMLSSGVTADSFRLWCTSHTPQLDLIFSMDKINEANRAIILVYNVANLASEYSDAIGYKPKKIHKPREISRLYPEDAWILSRLHNTIRQVTESLDRYEIYKAANAIRSFFIMDLSRFYLKIAKRRILYSPKASAKSTVDLINYLLYNSLLLIAPITPFVVEKVYLDSFGFEESIFLESWPRYDEKFVNSNMESQFDIALDATTALLNSREKANAKLRWPLANATVEVHSDEAFNAVQRLSGIIEGYTNVKRLLVKKVGRSNVEIRPLYAKIGPRFKENAGVVASALKDADSNVLMESIEKSGEYTLHTEKGPVEITQEYFEAVQRLERTDAVAFRHGMAYVDKEISRELYEEAMVREFERSVQLARKEMGLKKADRIVLRYRSSPEIALLIEKNEAKLRSDLSASGISREESVGAGFVKEFEVGRERIAVGIDRA